MQPHRRHLLQPLEAEGVELEGGAAIFAVFEDGHGAVGGAADGRQRRDGWAFTHFVRFQLEFLLRGILNLNSKYNSGPQARLDVQLALPFTIVPVNDQTPPLVVCRIRRWSGPAVVYYNFKSEITL